MNKKLWLSPLVAFYSSFTPVFSEPAIIRSGEHGSFSRLVVIGENLGDFETKNKSRNYELSFASFDQGFDISEAFLKIDRRRVTTLTALNSKLKLELGCECEVSISREGSNLIIIDVSDAKDKLYVNNFPVFGIIHSGTDTPLMFGKASDHSKSQKTTFPETFHYPIRIQTDFPSSEVTEDFPLPKEAPPLAIPFKEEKLVESALIHSFQSQLLNGFGIALTRGVLSTDVAPTNTFPLTSTLPISDLTQLNHNTNSVDSFSIETSIEPFTRKQKKLPEEKVNKSCSANSRLQVFNWSDGRPFVQQISDANETLYTTLEKIDVSSAVKLARLYLFFGFGAEAKKIIEIIPDSQRKWPELYLIASILNDQNVNLPLPLKESAHCGGPLLFWSTLSSHKNKRSFLEKKNRILFELSSLPNHLRRAVAPKVSARFLEIGSPSFAKAALQTLKRTEYTLDDDAKLEQTATLRANNQPMEALQNLTTIESNSYVAAEALLHKVQISLTSGIEIDQDTFGLIESYITEFEETEVGIELKKIAILTLSKSGQFMKALKKIRLIEEHEQPKILAEVNTDLVTMADDLTFVNIVFDGILDAPLKQQPELSLQFSERLFSLGFYNTAEEILNSSADKKPLAKYKLLNAKLSIAMNRPAISRLFLEGLTSPEAELLRAQILEMEEQHSEAAAIYQKMDRAEQQYRNAWLSDDWLANFENKDGIVSELSQIAKFSFSPLIEPSGMLGEIEDLLNESQQSRTVISEVIATPNLSP